MEILHAEKSFYDALRAAVESGRLDGIEFQPWHKGLDIVVEGSLDQEEKKELESLAGDWFYTTDLMYCCDVSPMLNGNQLELDVSFTQDLTEDGAEWDSDGFFQCLEPLISKHLQREIEESSLFVSLDLEGSDGLAPEISSLTVTLDTEDGDVDLALMMGAGLKEAIVSFAHQWAIDNLQQGSPANYSYSLNIEDAQEGAHLEERWSEKYILELI